jgi:hypothetical protein
MKNLWRIIFGISLILELYNRLEPHWKEIEMIDRSVVMEIGIVTMIIISLYMILRDKYKRFRGSIKDSINKKIEDLEASRKEFQDGKGEFRDTIRQLREFTRVLAQKRLIEKDPLEKGRDGKT